jgi:ribosomal protein RSM22 (predicted rRNA methylase)
VAQTRAQVLAYAAYRTPATYAAATAAFLAVAEQRSDWEPRSLLYLGAGLGAGSWAAVDVWPSIDRIVAIEAEARMIELGTELAPSIESEAAASMSWLPGRLGTVELTGTHDVVLLSYVLGELAPDILERLLARAWAATSGTLVVIEPGTPQGYARVLASRSQLLGAGGFTTAPCPHDLPCPLPNNDWCHFSVRLARSHLHRLVKQGSLGFEDEKFSYIAVSREPTPRTEARVLRHPLIRPGNIAVELCTPEGVKRRIITRSQRDAFRAARKADWGESFDAD